jgi:uncharacterized protein YwgA
MSDFEEMKLARVIDASGGIDGRVKMQKIVYLLRAMGYDLPFDDFRIRQHGPYSRAVACAADLLSDVGFVREKLEPLEIVNDLGEQANRYSYELEERASTLAKTHFKVEPPHGKPSIDEVAPKLKARDRRVLEVAATKVYLQAEEGLKGGELDTELRRLKGHLASSFDEADTFLVELRKEGLLTDPD